MARLFNALVVVGAGISASGCGGRAASDGSGASGGGSSGGSTGTGGSTATGGTSSGGTATGGSIGSGGAAGENTGGAGGAAATMAQWDCSAQFQRCQQLQTAVYIIQEPCPVDSSRPRSPAECANNEWFECTAASLNGATIAVNCDCTPKAANVQCTCVDASGVETTATCTDNVKVCACAHPSILIR